jgi:hypothetical protein
VVILNNNDEQSTRLELNTKRLILVEAAYRIDVARKYFDDICSIVHADVLVAESEPDQPDSGVYQRL